MGLEKDKILVGSKSHLPIAEESFGKQIYKGMLDAAPEDVVFIDAVTGKQTTYHDFLNLCCRLARSLQKAGYKANDVISVSGENSELYFAPIVAGLFLGIISAPLNHTYTQRELLHLVNISQPKLIFCTKKSLGTFAQLKQYAEYVEKIIVLDSEVSLEGFETMTQFIDKYCKNEFSTNKFEPVDVDPFNHVATILCSSGTTGMPKGVMVTHDNLSTRANQLMDPRLNTIDHQIICACLPFFHAFGFMMIGTSLPLRATFVIMQRFEEELFLKSIQNYRINSIHIVPPIAHFLVKSPLVLKFDLSSVQELLVGAAPVSQDVEAKLQERFPTLKQFRQGYGLTEGTISLAVMRSSEKRIGSTGKVVPNMLAYIRDVETGKALGPNAVGELCFKGRMVTKGYYRNPEATKDTYVNGWLHSGDLGYYDRDGYIYIVDRLKELIKYKGFQVPPAELEGILLTHPQVREVGVVGKPDDVAGELPTAFVVKTPGGDVTGSELIEFVAGRVSKPKQLHGGVYFVDVIPKTLSGKIMRRVLKELLIKGEGNKKSKL